MTKPISLKDWETFRRAREFTNAHRQNTLGKGTIAKFGAVLTEEQKDRIKYLDRKGTAFELRGYIETELVEK